MNEIIGPHGRKPVFLYDTFRSWEDNLDDNYFFLFHREERATQAVTNYTGNNGIFPGMHTLAIRQIGLRFSSNSEQLLQLAKDFSDVTLWVGDQPSFGIHGNMVDALPVVEDCKTTALTEVIDPHSGDGDSGILDLGCMIPVLPKSPLHVALNFYETLLPRMRLSSKVLGPAHEWLQIVVYLGGDMSKSAE